MEIKSVSSNLEITKIKINNALEDLKSKVIADIERTFTTVIQPAVDECQANCAKLDEVVTELAKIFDEKKSPIPPAAVIVSDEQKTHEQGSDNNDHVDDPSDDSDKNKDPERTSMF